MLDKNGIKGENVSNLQQEKILNISLKFSPWFINEFGYHVTLWSLMYFQFNTPVLCWVFWTASGSIVPQSFSEKECWSQILKNTFLIKMNKITWTGENVGPDTTSALLVWDTLWICALDIFMDKTSGWHNRVVGGSVELCYLCPFCTEGQRLSEGGTFGSLPCSDEVHLWPSSQLYPSLPSQVQFLNPPLHLTRFPTCYRAVTVTNLH